MAEALNVGTGGRCVCGRGPAIDSGSRHRPAGPAINPLRLAWGSPGHLSSRRNIKRNITQIVKRRVLRRPLDTGVIAARAHLGGMSEANPY